MKTGKIIFLLIFVIISLLLFIHFNGIPTSKSENPFNDIINRPIKKILFKTLLHDFTKNLSYLPYGKELLRNTSCISDDNEAKLYLLNYTVTVEFYKNTSKVCYSKYIDLDKHKMISAAMLMTLLNCDFKDIVNPIENLYTKALKNGRSYIKTDYIKIYARSYNLNGLVEVSFTIIS